jgi:VWFA-related protein
MTRETGVVVCAIVAGAFAIAPIGIPAATRQDQRPPVFRGGVNFVYVDAYPRRDGRLVEGLTADDFQVTEDGKPQHVEAFEFIRIEPNAPDTERRDPNTKEDGEHDAADPKNRVFVVYLDLYHTTFVGAHDTRTPLLDFLTRTIGPNDLFGVITPEVPVRQLVFGRRIDTLQSELTNYYDWGLEDQPVFPRTADEQALFSACGDDALIQWHREDVMATHLEELMAYLGNLRDERKNVLLVSEGWIPQQARVAQGSGNVPHIGPGPGGRLGIGVPQQGEVANPSRCDAEATRLRSIDFEHRFRDLLTLANRANVSFYPVDVGGLKTNLPDATMSRPPSPGKVLQMLNVGAGRVDTLRTLAENTDGRAVVNTNDLLGGFRQVADDLSAYYLLGYTSTNASLDGKYRQIEVKVNRPGVKVAARRGYFAGSVDPHPSATSAAPAMPAMFDEALGRLARLRNDAELFTYGVASASGLDVVAELSSAVVGQSEWDHGAAVQVTATHDGSAPISASGRIDPGFRGVLVHVPVDHAATGPWHLAIHASAGDSMLEDRLDVTPAAASVLLGDPVCFRGTASARVALRPVADFFFRRAERLHVEWPVLKPLDQRSVRTLDKRGQPMALGATVTEQEKNGVSIVAVDLNLSPLAEGDYLVELTAGAESTIERRALAFRVVR